MPKPIRSADNRPPSLRAFLDAGGDITTLSGWDVLAEGVLLHAPLEAEDRRSRARYLRDIGEAWLRGERPPFVVFTDGPDSPPDPFDPAGVTVVLWEADALEDDELAGRLEVSLPAGARADYLLLRVEMAWPEDEK